MPLFSPTLRRLAASTTSSSLKTAAAATTTSSPSPSSPSPSSPSRRLLAREALAKHLSNSVSGASSPLPVIPTCPSPTCACPETPSLPADLDIDHKTALNGTIAAYQKHILVGSGQSDWLSKIENEEKNGSGWGRLVAELKRAIGRGGEFHDDLSSSFWQEQQQQQQSVFLFPEFQHLLLDGELSAQEQARHLAKYALGGGGDRKDGAGSHQQHVQAQPITLPTILICSHGGRDGRCGTIGKLLIQEFTRQVRLIIPRQSASAAGAAGAVRGDEPSSQATDSSSSSFVHQAINIGGVSHIGGHKWAGNVILYIPPGYEITAAGTLSQDQEDRHLATATASPAATATTSPGSPGSGTRTTSPLAGMGIWYGRVEPRHVQGIIEQTILRGKIIQDLFRGGIDQQGKPLWL